MCGTISNEGLQYRIGTAVDFIDYRTKDLGQATWTGFIREDKLSWWTDRVQLAPVEIICTSFIEGKHELEVPSHRILGYVLLGTVIADGKRIGAKGELKMLTRAPMNTFEANLRPRWPVVKVGRNRKLHAFQSWDLKGKSQASQMPLL